MQFSMATPPKMEYRTLGGTGLVVSVLGFGTMTLKNVEHAKQLLSKCREGGVNFFDNAEGYGQPRGNAEILFGEAYRQLKAENPRLWRRSDVVITTKIFFGGSGDFGSHDENAFGTNELGLSRKHLMEGMKAALTRLQLDYVDVVYAHRPDPLTPMEEVVRGFTQLIRDGKAFYWGTSEWSAREITEAFWIAKCRGLIAPIVEQAQYSIVVRDRFETEYAPLYRAPYKIGTTIWGSLASGFLTGKYRFGNIPADSRRASEIFKRFEEYFKNFAEQVADDVEKFVNYADEIGVPPAQLAYAWTVKNKNVSVVIMGASKPQQLDETLKCLDVARNVLTDERMKKLDEIMGNKPAAPMTYGRVLQSKL